MRSSFIYIIEFSTGAIKVGTSVAVEGRIRSHERDAARYGVTIVRYWFGEAEHSRRAEEALIEAAHDLGGKPAKGRMEYFSGVAYDDLVEAGERISWREGVYARLS